MKFSLSISMLLIGTAALLQAAPVAITLPPETSAYKTGSGADLAQANCLMCHSADYISSQPPMTRKFWEATVKKMKEKYGAPTPDDQVAALVNYLTASYGVPDK